MHSLDNENLNKFKNYILVTCHVQMNIRTWAHTQKHTHILTCNEIILERNTTQNHS